MNIFNYIKICNECNKQYPKTPDNFNKGNDICVYCEDGTLPEWQKEQKEIYQKRKNYIKSKVKSYTKNLTDTYIANIICKNSDLNIEEVKKDKELIKLNRSQILLKRKLKDG